MAFANEGFWSLTRRIRATEMLSRKRCQCPIMAVRSFARSVVNVRFGETRRFVTVALSDRGRPQTVINPERSLIAVDPRPNRDDQVETRASVRLHYPRLP